MFSHVWRHSQPHLYLFWQLLLLILSHFYWSFSTTNVTFYPTQRLKNIYVRLETLETKGWKMLRHLWKYFLWTTFHDFLYFTQCLWSQSYEYNIHFTNTCLQQQAATPSPQSFYSLMHWGGESMGTMSLKLRFRHCCSLVCGLTKLWAHILFLHHIFFVFAAEQQVRVKSNQFSSNCLSHDNRKLIGFSSDLNQTLFINKTAESKEHLRLLMKQSRVIYLCVEWPRITIISEWAVENEDKCRFNFNWSASSNRLTDGCSSSSPTFLTFKYLIKTNKFSPRASSHPTMCGQFSRSILSHFVC